MPGQTWASANHIRTMRGRTPDHRSKVLSTTLILVLGPWHPYMIVGPCTESKPIQLPGVNHDRQRRQRTERTSFKYYDTDIGCNPLLVFGIRQSRTLLFNVASEWRYFTSTSAKLRHEVNWNYVPTVVNISPSVTNLKTENAGCPQTFNNPGQ